MAQNTGETRAEYLARINSTRADGTPAGPIPQATPATKKDSETCSVTGGPHQFKARRSAVRRAAKVGAGAVFLPLAALGGKNMRQCSACGKKVKW